MKFKYIMAFSLLLIPELSLYASDFRCNRKQTRCSVENVRLTIGDQIGILNEDKELVATAEIDGIQGRSRQFKVTKKHGRIYNGYQVARLDSDASVNKVEDNYKVFKKSSDTVVTGIGEIASLAVGEGVFSYGAQGYYESKIKKYLYWTGRGFYQMGSGNIRPVYSGTGISTINASVFGGMGGIAYKTKRRGDLVLRSEAALGFGYMMADIDGDDSLIESEVEQFSNGFGLAGRLEMQAIYQGYEWNPAILGSFGMMQSARVTTVGIGLSKSLD